MLCKRADKKMLPRFAFSDKAVSLLIVLAFFITVAGFAWAYNSSGSGGSPPVMGHSVDEMDWSKPLPGNLLVSGNVGIGTMAPTQKLDVAGNVRGTQLCIGADCRSAWPSAGGVTSISAGTGITLTPNPIIGTGSISANTAVLQQRVTGTCAINQAIRVVNANGTVACVNIPSSAICTWSGKTYSTGYSCYTGICKPASYIRWRCQEDGSWISGLVACESYPVCGT